MKSVASVLNILSAIHIKDIVEPFEAPGGRGDWILYGGA